MMRQKEKKQEKKQLLNEIILEFIKMFSNKCREVGHNDAADDLLEHKEKIM
jgi:5-methylthioribose kinase